MREWFTAAELADRFPALPKTIRGVNLRATRESWRWRDRSGRGGGREFHISDLPPEAQAAIAVMLEREAGTGTAPEAEAAGTGDAWARFEALPEKAKAKARDALALVQAAEALIAAGGQRRKSVYEVAAAAGVDPSTLYRKFQAVRGVAPEHRLPALAPRHRGRQTTAACSPEAWEYFKADYLRPAQPAAEACYERLARVAGERGWTVPSIGTLRRRIEREVPRPVFILARQGTEALKRAYPAQERDRSHFAALEAVNVDGHKFDVFVTTADGRKMRPALVAWQDLYSGKIMSWRLAETECAEAVRLSIADLVETWGIPRVAYMDNGRGFASKWITGRMPNRYRFKVRDEDPSGVLTDLSVEVHWCKPGSGQSKPVERSFGDLAEYIARHPLCDGAYTGNSPDRKPADYDSRTVAWADFEALVAEEIRRHNARGGRRSAVCDGRYSFNQVFAESYERQPIRKASEAQRRSMLLAGEGVAAHREDCSLRLHGNRYWSEALTRAGIGGRKVVVRFDPQRLDQPVHVYTIDGRYIAPAERIEKTGFDSTDDAKAHEKDRRRFFKATKDQLAAAKSMSAREAAEMLPRLPDGDPAPAATVVRPAFTANGSAALRQAPLRQAQGEVGEEQAEAPATIIDQRDEFSRRLSAGLRVAKQRLGR